METLKIIRVGAFVVHTLFREPLKKKRIEFTTQDTTLPRNHQINSLHKTNPQPFSFDCFSRSMNCKLGLYILANTLFRDLRMFLGHVDSMGP